MRLPFEQFLSIIYQPFRVPGVTPLSFLQNTNKKWFDIIKNDFSNVFLGGKGSGEMVQGDLEKKKLSSFPEERNEDEELRKEGRVNDRGSKMYWPYI
jgi:hypothetical protein